MRSSNKSLQVREFWAKENPTTLSDDGAVCVMNEVLGHLPVAVDAAGSVA